MDTSCRLPVLRAPSRFTIGLAVGVSLFISPSLRGQAVIERTAANDIPTVTTEDVQRIVEAAEESKATQADDIQRIIAAGRENSQVMAHLDYLTNRIGPRLTSSDNLTNACEWTREKFESLGLANSHMDKWADWPVGFNRGPWSGKMVTPEELPLEFATNSWTAGTKGKQRGPAKVAPKNDEELAAVKDQLAGKWILAGPLPERQRQRGGNRGQRGARDGERGGESARADGQPAEATRNAEQAAAQPTRPDSEQPAADARPDRQQAENREAGSNRDEARPATDQAAAGQPAAEGPTGDAAEGNRRGRGGRGRRGETVDPFQQKLRATYQEVGILGTINRTNSELIVALGRRPTSDNFFNEPLPPPQLIMAQASYDAVDKRVRNGEEVTLEFDIRNYFKKGPIPIYNVVADIPGSQLPDEYVIVGGHLDSFDSATGTTDNGTGCATTMEAARILIASGVKPKRTIRFMLWTGEEQGLLGSEAYVRNNPELMKNISAVFVHDAGTQFISGIRGLPTQMNDLKQVFAPVISLDPEFPFEVVVTNALRTGGSDHSPFIRAGVSGFFWSQSGDLARYRDTHHTTLDTYDRAVPEYQKHSSIVVALAAYGVANLDHMLPRPEAE
jgi:hypothetical protein